MDTAEAKLNSVISWLNSNYNQDSENYCVFRGSKPEVLRYDEHTAISLWACGAIVCINATLFFVCEDDGNWFLNSHNEGKYERYYGYQDSFSIGWIKSFRDALTRLDDYVTENGHPVYYSGLPEKIVCHYSL